MTTSGRISAICALFIVACSTSERAPKPGTGAGGGSGNVAGTAEGGRSAGSTSKGGSAGHPDASGGDAGNAQSGGAAGDAAADAGAGSGGTGNASGGRGQGGVDDQFLCPSDSSGGTAPSIGSQCDPGAAWGAGEILEVEASGLDYLVAITPDELSLVWFVAGGSAGAYFIADRAAVDAAFEPPVLIPGPVVTLSPDGLRLVTLSPDGAFLERSRAARGEAFGDAEEGSFALLNAAALANGHTFQECVVSPDDQSLYYNVYGDDADLYPLRVSQRTGSEPWAIGEPIEACELKALGSLARRPTAISADGLTLFFFDPARDVARAAFRRTVDGPFIHFADLGDRRQAQPNQACDRLYYSANDGSSGLFAATAQ